MTQPQQPWFKNPAFVGLLLTLGGFGVVTLLYWLYSVLALGL